MDALTETLLRSTGAAISERFATANQSRHVQSRPSGWIGTELVNPARLS
jgi:hypothetical protein